MLTLHEIFQDWPLYKYSQAPELVEIDYKYAYPNKDFCYANWESFGNIAIEFFKDRIKDTSAKMSLVEANEVMDSLNTGE